MKKNSQWRVAGGIGVGILIFLAVFSGCSIKTPQSPQWDVHVAVPLIDTTLTVQDLLDSTDNVTFDSTGLLGFSFEQTMDPFQVGENLTVENISENFNVSLGDIRIPSPGTQSTTVQFAAIYPGAVLLNGQNAQIPAISFGLDTTEIPAFGDFESILIKEGTIRIELVNRLPIPIDSGLNVQLFDFNTDTLVISASTSQAILPGGHVPLIFQLANKWLPGHLSFRLKGSSVGSEGESVYIDATGQGVDFDVTISDIVAVEARAKIPDQEFSDLDYATLSDSIIVTEADIETGTISFLLQNKLPLDLDLDITLLSFFTTSGDTFRAHLSLKSGQIVQQEYDLSGYQFKPTRTPDGVEVRFRWKAHAYGSGDQIITIRSNDGIALAVNIPKLAFSKFSGILNQVHFTLDPMTTSLDLPEGLEGLAFENARLELILTNGLGFLIKPVLKIQGVNTHTGREAEIIREVTIQPAGFSPSVNRIILQGNEITQFLNVLPDEITVSGSVVLGDGLTESTIRSTDQINTQVNVSIPVSLKFPEQSLTTDVSELEIDSTAQDEIRNNLRDGSLHAEIGNHLPLGASVTFYFSALDTNVYDSPQLTIGPIEINAGSRAQDGTVVQEAQNTVDVALDREQLQIFANPTVYTGTKIRVPGSGDAFIRVYGSDYISTKAYLKIGYRVNFEGDQ